MKSKYLSAAAALLCAAGLAACGGKGNGSISLGVNVVGLDRAGLVLQNNGGDDLTVSAAGLYYFATMMAPDAQFNVTIKTLPAGVTCTLANNSAKINYYTYQQTVVNCVAVPASLGGKVTGLTGNGLVLANGAMTVGVIPAGGADVAWKFSDKIGNKSVYGVTVLSQPAGQHCEVTANGVGTMPLDSAGKALDVDNVAVTCTANT